MNIIRILPEKVASQIAAGEVVDRPASVVRELIDNSIDAGADRIVVSIERGGKRLIKVSDNGTGMSRDDILLCIERYATSKIETASDLLSIKSLGFRGEALPSIASISRLQILSRPQGQTAGNRLKVSGGKLVAMDEAGAPGGTIVEVRDLFFNVPARRKFLRAARTEMDHIVDILSRVALPYPAITFRLDEAGRSILNLQAADLQLPRISALMGRKVAESMIEIQKEEQDLMIRAFLAPPELDRTRGDRLFFYVNGRNIRDRLLTRAVMEGYGQRLMKGRYPQAVVFISMDTAKVDINVHPTKQEVGFRNSSPMFQAVSSIVDKALTRSFHVSRDSRNLREAGNAGKDGHNLISESLRSYSRGRQAGVVPAGAELGEQQTVGEAPQVIGQLGNTYILCQVRDGLLMVDQHAAHERIVYEDLKTAFRNSHIEAQTLLVPYNLELSMKEKRIVLERGSHLVSLGIELDHFGGDTFLLRSVPAILTNVQWDLFLSELILELERSNPEEDAIFKRVLPVMACHGSIRAGHHMTHEEMDHLINRLEEMALPTNCPHGRPIFKRFTYYEIERMFKRVV